jgi:hypothetical protein
MPISSDPAARQRQLDALARARESRTPPGHRTTHTMRLTLPESAATVFEGLDRDQRTKVVLAGLGALDNDGGAS